MHSIRLKINFNGVDGFNWNAPIDEEKKTPHVKSHTYSMQCGIYAAAILR